MSQEATRLNQIFKSILVLFGDDDPPIFLEQVSDLAAIDGVKLTIAITALWRSGNLPAPLPSRLREKCFGRGMILSS